MDEAEYCGRLALMYRGKVIALGSPAELKRGLTSHSLLHLDSSEPLETMRALESVTGVLDVAVFGGGLHVTVDDAEATSARMRRGAGGEGNRSAAAGADRAVDGGRFRGHDRGRGAEGGMSYRRLRAIFVKELHHITRDSRSLALALVDAGDDAAAVRLRAEPGRGPHPHADLRPGPDPSQPRPDPAVPGVAVLRDPRLCGQLRAPSNATSTAAAS